MEEGDSQTQTVGPYSKRIIKSLEAKSSSDEYSETSGTHNISIKQIKQYFTAMYDKLYSQQAPAAAQMFQRRENSAESAEIQAIIQQIVQVIEHTKVDSPAGFDLLKISVYLSNYILCLDAAYKEDFLNEAENIFQSLSEYFVEAYDQSQSQSQSQSVSSSSSYQALVLIYKLLMSTRSQSSRASVIAMREKLLSRKFMRRILELDVEEFTPVSHTPSETSAMLVAFHALFARKKEMIMQFNLGRLAKEAFFEGLHRAAVTTMTTQNNILQTHQTLACIHFAFDALSLTSKDLSKHQIVPFICQLLSHVHTTSAQAKMLFTMLFTYSKAMLFNATTVNLSMLMAVAFKAFEKAPAQAMQLAVRIFALDQQALIHITLQATLVLARNLAMKWGEIVGVRRSLQGESSPPLQSVEVSLRIAQCEVEERMKYVVDFLNLMARSAAASQQQQVFQAILQQLEVLVFPLVNSLEVSTLTNGTSQQLEGATQQERALFLSFNPPCLGLHESTLILIEQLLLSQVEEREVILQRLAILSIPLTLHSIFQCLVENYQRLQLSHTNTNKRLLIEHFSPFFTTLKRTLKQC